MSEMIKENKVNWIVIGIISFLAVGLFITVMIGMQKQKEYFTEYTIATNYLDSVIYKQKIAEINYRNYLDYTTQEEGYYYEDASIYLDNTLSSLKKSLEELDKSKLIFNSISEKSPSVFYIKEIELRIKHTDILYEISEKRIEIIEISNEE